MLLYFIAVECLEERHVQMENEPNLLIRNIKQCNSFIRKLLEDFKDGDKHLIKCTLILVFKNGHLQRCRGFQYRPALTKFHGDFTSKVTLQKCTLSDLAYYLTFVHSCLFKIQTALFFATSADENS